MCYVKHHAVALLPVSHHHRRSWLAPGLRTPLTNELAWPQVLSGMLLRLGLRWRLGGVADLRHSLRGAPIRALTAVFNAGTDREAGSSQRP